LGNPESTAQNLLRVLDDPELRARLAANARRRMIDEFSTARVAGCYEELFAQVLGRERVEAMA
jgi:glycosyltransferase involved in cell wall biosynthesis